VTLLLALAVGVVFGAGAYLLMATNLLRVIVGLILVSNAANLALMSAGLRRGQAPVAPFGDGPVSDALVQAMTLTALVIGLAVITLLLVMVLRIHRTQRTIDFDDLRHAEERSGEEEPVADVGPPEDRF
jgi:multicomponent Na+:H+ antiporter subunit C